MSGGSGQARCGALAALLISLVYGLTPACAQTSAGEYTQQTAAEAEQGVAQAHLIAIGQRLYREGIRPAGEPLVSAGPAQTARSGKDAACAACHRRSGYGTTEGRFVIRPIIGPALREVEEVALRSPRVKARLGTSLRPPYTEATLARAIRSGVDAAGKPLDTLMPRYTLSDEEMHALTAYLFTLSAHDSPGVDQQEIHFATVIQPGVAPAKRRAMLDIMQAFVKDKDANVRSEEQRRDAGNMRMYRAYRKWVLHVWELSGPSDTWGTQLEAYYRAQPVFALIGGLGTVNWRPIHEFSERFEIPCVFPQVEVPNLAPTNNYTFYFSKGVTLEAEVLAKYLRDQGESGSILQVYRAEAEASATAAAAFKAALPGAAIAERVLQGTADKTFWDTVLGAQPAVLVLWLGAEDLAGVAALGATPTVYLSSSLTGAKPLDALLTGGGSIRLIYPSDLPPKREARLLRNKLWLHNKNIALTEETVQMNTQFTMAVMSDVLGHLQDSFSRDYFVERVEHMVTQTPMASIYQQVSLGPGQRFAAKGSAIVQLIDPQKKLLKPLSGWIVP